MRRFLLAIGLIALSSHIFGQDSTVVQISKPVRNPWYSTLSLDNQTTYTPPQGTWEFNIIHRFSSINQGFSDLFGFYGSANISLFANYGISDNIMLGFETVKEKKLQVFKAKYKIIEQTRDGRIPVSLALYGNACINAQKEAEFGKDFKEIDRMSYFCEGIVSRKIGKSASILASVGYSHINKVSSIREKLETISTNKVDTIITTITTTTTRYYPEFKNDAISFSLSGRSTVWRSIGVIAEFNYSSYLEKTDTLQNNPKPSLSLGFEVNTPTHVLQLFLSSYRSIVPQYNYIMNQIDMTKKDGLMIGFNIFIRI